VEKNFKQRLKKIRNAINLWNSRGLSIHGKVNIIKAILLPKLIYPSSVISTPSEVIKEFNNLVFHFSWNGKDKVIRSSTYAPCEQGGLKMIDYETMTKALRLSSLMRITDEDLSGFWKSYLNYLLDNERGLFLLQCNYDVNQINISSTFYQDLLVWWSNIREIIDPNNVYKYVIWNNKEIKIDGISVFYKHYFNMNIKYTNDLLFDKPNIESFNVLRSEGLTRSNFLVWTGLRQSIPLKLRVNIPNFKVILDLESLKCHDHYCFLIKQKLEKPSKWVNCFRGISFASEGC